MPDLPPSLPAPIVVTASRLPETTQTTTGSVSIVDSDAIARLGMPQISDYLRLLPSAAVSVSGPAGSLTEVRIRGAEANHTLLFIDGIRANDPAAGNTPRFELLNADLVSRIELVRGPQSALWGSEAIGGVIAVSDEEGGTSNASLLGEGGSFATLRGAASARYASPDVTASVGVAGRRSCGTDAFDGTGDRDGYDNRSARARVAWRAARGVELGVTTFASAGRSEFDGYSPTSFLHADTLDNTRNRLAAARGSLTLGAKEGFGGTVSASWLRSSNRNYLDRTFLNWTMGKRRTINSEVHDAFELGSTTHRVLAAFEQEDEGFKARDIVYGGATDQDRDRRRRSATVEWRSDIGPISSDLAVRRDAFNRFSDATTVRASLLARLGRGFAATLSFGEGIAQPTFYDLYGFFPREFRRKSSSCP